MEKPKSKTILVPPDGGWGWMIVLASALGNIVNIPMMLSFGLIFRRTFADLGLNMKDTAFIINTNSAFGMLMGIFNGSILKNFGYRKGAIAGALLASGGITLTAFANSFTFYFFSYGIITSLGFSLILTSFSLAVNTYFKKRRGKAVGLGLTVAGIGPILTPLLLSYLLEEYGASGAVLIIGAISLHSLIAAALLQPVKWHMKEVIPDLELMPVETNKENEFTLNLLENDNCPQSDIHEITESTLSIDHDVETQSIYGFETSLPRRKLSQASMFDGRQRKRNFSRSESQPEKKIEAVSTNSLNSLQLIAGGKAKEVDNDKNRNTIAVPTGQNILEEPEKKQTLMSKISEFFDLDLLKDPGYLSLMFGISLVICAELNFALLIPFILNDFGLSTYETAQIMSTGAATDIVFRFCAPFISDWLRIDPKLMFMFSLVILMTGKTALLFARGSFYGIMAVIVALGMGKGFRITNMYILLPNYVPLSKLPSASGIQMVSNGITNLISGPILGAIRDYTGSYNKCIIVINLITSSTLAMWTLQYIYNKIKKNR